MVTLDTQTFTVQELLKWLEEQEYDAIIIGLRRSTQQAGLINISGGWISLAITSKLPQSLAQYVIYSKNIDTTMLPRIIQRDWNTNIQREYMGYIKKYDSEAEAAKNYLIEKVKVISGWTNAKIIFIPKNKISEHTISNIPPVYISEVLEALNSNAGGSQDVSKFLPNEEDYLTFSPMAASILVKHPELDDLSWKIFLMVKTSNKKVKEVVNEIYSENPNYTPEMIKERIVTLLKLGVLVRKPASEAKKKKKSKKGPYSKGIIQKFISLLRKKI